MHVDFFFFNDTATTEIYTLSLHDALPISVEPRRRHGRQLVQEPGQRPHVAIEPRVRVGVGSGELAQPGRRASRVRSEEHTSELQSRQYLVCRLLLEKKKNDNNKQRSLITL